jgi:hypothetical protein
MGWGSGIRDPGKPLPDPGSRGQKGAGSQIRIRNTDFRQVRRSSNVTGEKVIRYAPEDID